MKTDTTPDAQRILIEGYRKMSPARKLERVFDLSETLNQLARARIRTARGAVADEREIDLRVAALRLGRETMMAVFDFDPLEGEA